MAPVSQWDILGSKWTCCLQSWCVRSRKNGQRKDLSEFGSATGSEHRQNCSSCGVFLVSSGQYPSKWSKEGAVVNQQQGHGQPRLIEAPGEQRPVWSDPTDELHFIDPRSLSVQPTAVKVRYLSQLLCIVQICNKSSSKCGKWFYTAAHLVLIEWKMKEKLMSEQSCHQQSQ